MVVQIYTVLEVNIYLSRTVGELTLSSSWIIDFLLIGRGLDLTFFTTEMFSLNSVVFLIIGVTDLQQVLMEGYNGVYVYVYVYTCIWQLQLKTNSIDLNILESICSRWGIQFFIRLTIIVSRLLYWWLLVLAVFV